MESFEEKKKKKENKFVQRGRKLKQSRKKNKVYGKKIILRLPCSQQTSSSCFFLSFPRGLKEKEEKKAMQRT